MKKLLAIMFVVTTANPATADDFNEWLARQEKTSIDKMLQNISPSDAVAGVVIASPERENPPYYYHWVRDSGVTIDLLVNLYAGGARHHRQKIMDFANFSRRLQMTKSKSGMGEPKYHVDGVAFDGDWCRPQNDGPALRATALIKFAHKLLNEGDSNYVKNVLYDGKIPTDTVIKADLEFVAHHWEEKNCDLWEEIYGDHFYTRMVQRRAMIDGANLAERLGDKGAAQFYREQAGRLASQIDKHWDNNKKVFVPTLNRTGGIDYKNSGLDASIILGVLHSDGKDNYMSYRDERLASTAEKLVSVFKNMYAINSNGAPGVAIGRYPEDRYGGTHFNHGNPWFLITAAFAQYKYRLAQEVLTKGDVKRARALISEGDSYLRRIRVHGAQDGSMSEQMDKNTGFMTSARDLTWSYVEFIKAVQQRAKLGKLAQ